MRPRLLVAASAVLMAGWIALGSTAPALAQAPSGEPKQAPPMPAPKSSQPAMPQPGDAFGEEVTLPDRTIVYLKGHTNWDTAFDTLLDAFKSLNDFLAKQNVKPAGPFLTIYTETDDTGFSFQAAATIAQPLANPPKGDIAMDKGPSGKALKFVHRGSYDSMDATYEAITNFLDDRQLEAKDLFIEEYASDPVKSDPNNLVVNIYVPVK
ncbi:GyrI-like domain-containing protein [Pseudolabrys sp. Root1462]|uniref:GyrI-like domain-containing protein n=1 Tax=Pseudolabrys sp. Root1462 TaxID=1736466 RepID=UPI001FCE08B0|nr:GyrI-like domain-containing protein [Pseudolabrys sp. Root1462]